MAKKTKLTRKSWSKADDAAIRKHSRTKTRADQVAKLLKRSEGAVRQRAFGLGIPLGHQR
jgi:hypothetical protein